MELIAWCNSTAIIVADSVTVMLLSAMLLSSPHEFQEGMLHLRDCVVGTGCWISVELWLIGQVTHETGGERHLCQNTIYHC